MLKNISILLSGIVLISACDSGKAPIKENALKPAVITEQVGHDTDDPAIWINPADSMKSLIIGTDKDTDGGLYAFDLEGKIVKKVPGLKRPNNVDIAYGLLLNGAPVDIAVLTERETNRIRIFSLPDLLPLDNGGIEVFTGETERDPMGIALYKRPSDSAIFAIVGRKSGPVENYLWQYRLEDDGKGAVKAALVRKFGQYSGKKEIEAIAVDNQLGYVYCSDETVGIRKYKADPDQQDNTELAHFGKEGFVSDHEGISIYPLTDSTGYILVSNQQNNTFMVYPREGNEHPLLAEVPVSTIESDGSEVTAVPLGSKFPQGLFVAMSNGKVFHYYSWKDIADQIR
ncbi:phytase [Chitinophaga sp. XS-30]|uniref:phytase n=1 Tax=Chitinophaga sp. XS-30 TaxID=2604421 RepID=UPI0011DDE636|nr:phytase [Chitinophaga sp. XS-30]QEH43216.1 phytase [Chitinophaga sp. XS-30]